MASIRLIGECRDAENIGILVSYLLLGGANAVLYNIVHYRVIQITSSTATPVIGKALCCCNISCMRSASHQQEQPL